MNKAKMKQVAFISAVSLGTIFLLNTLSRRVAPVEKARQVINAGV